jgi:hypothetical protein
VFVLSRNEFGRTFASQSLHDAMSEGPRAIDPGIGIIAFRTILFPGIRAD